MGNLANSSSDVTVNSPLVIGGNVATDVGTLITGQDLVAGSVLGRITASGKITLSNPAAGDGSEEPVGILVHDIDATAEDKDCQIYVGGEFNSTKLNWHAGFTATLQKSAFDGTPIQVKTPI